MPSAHYRKPIASAVRCKRHSQAYVLWLRMSYCALNLRVIYCWSTKPLRCRCHF
ncbi:Uncharacterised protein [Vibrio cholerae]|nr:Uncharacterised protein [Vibrio cholerae]